MSEFYERQRAIRAVVAAQWAVAIAWWMTHDHYDGSARRLADSTHRFGLAAGALALGWIGREIAAFPCAVDVVDGL